MSHCSFHFDLIVGFCSQCKMLICNVCLPDHVAHLGDILVFKKTQAKMKELTQKVQIQYMSKAKKFIDMKKQIEIKKQQTLKYYDNLLQDAQRQQNQLQQTELAKLRQKLLMYNSQLYNDLDIKDIEHLQQLSDGKHQIPKLQLSIQIFIKTFKQSLTGFGKSKFNKSKNILNAKDLQQAGNIIKEAEKHFLQKQFEKSIKLFQNGFQIILQQLEDQFGYYFYDNYNAYQQTFRQAIKNNLIQQSQKHQCYQIFQRTSLMGSLLKNRKQEILESLVKGFTNLQLYENAISNINKRDVLLQKFSDQGQIAYLKSAIMSQNYDQGIKNIAQISISQVKKSKGNVLSNSPLKSYLIIELYLATNQPFAGQNYIKNLENITKQNIIFNETRLTLGKLYIMKGEHNKALHKLDQCSQIYEPSDYYINTKKISFLVQLTLLKIQCLKAMNKNELALKHLKQLQNLTKIKQNNQNIVALQIAKAKLYTKSQDFPNKEESVTKALGIKPNDLQANKLRNQLNIEIKQIEKKSKWCLR